MKRVRWTNNPTNVRSGAVARRLGITREGLLRTVAPDPTPPTALEQGQDRR
jgi:RimJ/RimL family protein N-acetyltransferase